MRKIVELGRLMALLVLAGCGGGTTSPKTPPGDPAPAASAQPAAADAPEAAETSPPTEAAAPGGAMQMPEKCADGNAESVCAPPRAVRRAALRRLSEAGVGARHVRQVDAVDAGVHESQHRGLVHDGPPVDEGAARLRRGSDRRSLTRRQPRRHGRGQRRAPLRHPALGRHLRVPRGRGNNAEAPPRAEAAEHPLAAPRRVGTRRAPRRCRRGQGRRRPAQRMQRDDRARHDEPELRQGGRQTVCRRRRLRRRGRATRPVAEGRAP